MLDDSLTPEPFERLLTALLELPPPQSHEAGDGAAQLVLEVIDTALHTPPAWPQRMAAVRFFCQHARHRLGLESLRDLQALLKQYPQSDESDDEVARLLWNVEAREHVRALRVLGEALRARLPGLQVLVQGEGTRHSLMERFRQGSAQGAPGCVLVASVSFWEGVDVPGSALQMVVIDKLPFPPPNDPLVEARSQRVEREGRSAFSAYSMPEAAVALKQGAGRLIRSETDRGVLVIGDTRLTAMGYGKRLLASLPPMRVLKTEAEFGEMLATLAASSASTSPLTTSSTMDPTWP